MALQALVVDYWRSRRGDGWEEEVRERAMHDHRPQLDQKQNPKACTLRVRNSGVTLRKIINTSYQKLPFGSGDDPDKLFFFFTKQ